MADESDSTADHLCPSTPAVAVIIPAYNEERLIVDTLQALQDQEFDAPLHREVLHGFRVVVVDNNSTDRTPDLVREFIEAGTRFPTELISETEKGSGCAADTGARHAIASGARYIARTDADSHPAPDWLATLLTPLFAGKRLVGGRVKARDDEDVSPFLFNAVGKLWRVGHAVEYLRTARGPAAARRSYAVVGNNMAIDVEMYLESGGFPRTRMEDVDDDTVLQSRVRSLVGPKGIALQKNALVYTSQRRQQAFGIKGLLEWYSGDRNSTDLAADVR
ncbi:glycosyltransferase family 2 protein [Gordonia polyisoprenivorans]|uniref:glycosyltransferase n=1 Tax=Gordonia polyisoprenivorans TaxID=84595 RepID=UPI001B8B6DFB|nr:glycosyltransferase family 2 protein [Gordonia polyisoprenivorans]QUD83437.1 glycosyltransferase family 2 protein [Gordonia polyisoprenivorans]